MPVAGARIVFREVLERSNGKPTSFRERTDETDDDGSFEIRVTTNWVDVRFFHPDYVTCDLNLIEVDLIRNAKRTRDLGTYRAEAKPYEVTARVRKGGGAAHGVLRTYEFPMGAGPHMELGNHFSEVTLPDSGNVTLKMDRNKACYWTVDGRRLQVMSLPDGAVYDDLGNVCISRGGGTLELRDPGP
jgi:hypothetical protein